MTRSPSSAARRRTKEDWEPNPIDRHVGQRLRQRRTLLGMSQERLADMIGLTFQQVQKYERGANRVSASRLYRISVVLGVSVGYFFDEMADGDGPARISPAGTTPTDLISNRETLELVRNYLSMSEPARRHLLELTKEVSEKP